MATIPTRTLNPLPFGDLEPHRFEDLIRQLAYELRRWKSLEATGRGGSDEGIDVRGVELVPVADEITEEDADEDNTVTSFDERLWIFQCKREKSLGPAKLRKVIEESLASLASPPHGFVLAVACDVSKAARDTFREEMVACGVAEFILWAKGELEDMLFQPKNDRLLFAYFGIALQPRRRSLSTTLRAAITKKKQLTALLKDEEETRDGKLILLRDPTDERYPYEPEAGTARPRWLLCRALTLKKPGYLVVLWRQHLAATTPDGSKWDAIEDYDLLKMTADGELQSAHAWSIREDDYARRATPHNFWNEYIPDGEQAYLKVRRAIPLERILALDPLGDGFYPVPHLLVEFDDANGPFTADHFPLLTRAHHMGGQIDIELDDTTRTEIFPNPLPKEGDPPPASFDNSIAQTMFLSSAGGEKLGAFLSAIATRRAEMAAPATASAPSKLEEDAHGAMLQFREWRDTVALPLFSRFVAQLRANGHFARVVIRSREASPGHDPSESITLRVGLLLGTAYNPRYRADGHVRAAHSGHFGRRLEIAPSDEDMRDTRSRDIGRAKPLATSNEPLSQDELESQVLVMLERLGKRGY